MKLHRAFYMLAFSYIPNQHLNIMFHDYRFQGAQEVFQHLPHEYVSPSMLPKISKHGDLNKLYACEVQLFKIKVLAVSRILFIS